MRRFILIAITAFIVCSCQAKIEKLEQPLMETINTATGVIFNEQILINDVSYLRQSEVDYDKPHDLVRWIHDDTIVYEVDALFVAERIIDINQDGLDDLVIIYNTTQGKLFVCFLFDGNIGRLTQPGWEFHIDKAILYSLPTLAARLPRNSCLSSS
jgi:hypothetical protein